MWEHVQGDYRPPDCEDDGDNTGCEPQAPGERLIIEFE